ncbi:hypothetical protein P280DRAFT_466734 [Massarina eburnea CBS 473.64]|uniref:DUF1996 domain-containing protein n=1 Tax=Massarina eburnea CBS 473.64 TaxID=1395130 RepID=A0A6A6S845_9PLEO|nr:hypothetical protein P280DRAFT_466734 [Massarina eburnea CBS 473.64]
MFKTTLLSLGLLGGIGLVPPVTAFFTITCPRIVRDRLDPIVSPGRVSGHVHNIVGGAGFGPNYTYEEALASKCTSCPVKEDKSNYWTPQLYVKMRDGTFRVVPQPDDDQGGMTIYYLSFDTTHPVTPFPRGFAMVGGDALLRAPSPTSSSRGLSYWCKGGHQSDYAGLPTEHCPSGIRIQFHMPNCWNGEDVTPPTDGRKHVVYMDGDVRAGTCPEAFPYRLPQLFYEVNYDTQVFAEEWVGRQHPFTFAQGDGTGFGFHGDFTNGWDDGVLGRVVRECFNVAFDAVTCAGNAEGGFLTRNREEDVRACKIGGQVGEEVLAPVGKLPGCNTVTYGPERATAGKGNCTDDVHLLT